MENEKRITLTLDKTLSRLAGNEFGKEIYNNQVKNNVDYNKKNIIVFPDNVENVAISFVQGFCADIFLSVAPTSFYKHFEIDAKEKVKQKFQKAIFF